MARSVQLLLFQVPGVVHATEPSIMLIVTPVLSVVTLKMPVVIKKKIKKIWNKVLFQNPKF